MRRFSLLENALFGDSAGILRALLQLRLFVLSGSVCFLWLLDMKTSRPVNYPLILLVIGCAAIWSIRLLMRQHRSRPSTLARELIFDGLWLSAVVFFSGRSENPFIYYFLVLIAVAATLLSVRAAWLFSLGAVAVYTLFLYLDINDHFDHMAGDYQFHLLGMWINFCGSSIVTCYFISKLATALRQHQEQLGRVREETLKNEQLVGIGTLAASTVHALGTPLSTLTILLGEMRNSAEDEEKRHDIDTMLNQIGRCKDTMKKLALLAEHEDDKNLVEPVDDLIENLREHYFLSQPAREMEFLLSNSCGEEKIRQSLLLRHALINLIDNAVDAAAHQVTVLFRCDETHLFITIGDDGPGMPNQVLREWGKPQRSSKESGLGIGVLLANSTIERMGGTVAIQAPAQDTAASAGGVEFRRQTHVLVTLPLAKVR